jgi:hypothetical protein
VDVIVAMEKVEMAAMGRYELSGQETLVVRSVGSLAFA